MKWLTTKQKFYSVLFLSCLLVFIFVLLGNKNNKSSKISEKLSNLNYYINIKENEVYNCRNSQRELDKLYMEKKEIMNPLGLN